jgi:hypothetical protein
MMKNVSSTGTLVEELLGSGSFFVFSEVTGMREDS